MNYQSHLQQIFQCAAQFPWITNELPVLNVKDVNGLGKMVTFVLELDAEQDDVFWKDYNQENQHIVVWLQGFGDDCPRFEAGHGPMYFDMNDQDITRALLQVLESIRIEENDE